jgi:fatty acid desaturase
MTLSVVTAVYWVKKKEKKKQRKKLRKLRWTLLKTFFTQKRKKNIGLVIFYFLLMAFLSVLLVLWVGWLPGIVTFLLSLLVIYAMP